MKPRWENHPAWMRDEADALRAATRRAEIMRGIVLLLGFTLLAMGALWMITRG